MEPEITFWVQLWSEVKWDGKPYEKVIASTPKEAAEKLHRHPSQEIGSHSQLRAQVRLAGRPTGIAFYES